MAAKKAALGDPSGWSGLSRYSRIFLSEMIARWAFGMTFIGTAESIHMYIFLSTTAAAASHQSLADSLAPVIARALTGR
jgi:hypothetical protein